MPSFSKTKPRSPSPRPIPVKRLEMSHPVFALKKRYITDTSFDSSSKAKEKGRYILVAFIR
ncbi:hypothetical protein M378DRAFT_171433 [Amanita muscaria Koide BX008]|uniref:Uncharacterized protein n=1 Tax=Amanita muscaria (strain Koide BX008) TaxID=946122 RepID=A0A0C2S4V6_AMAMK|nr:hypothetical protein M378DRAFT_171433 [Amanita muscaria Koide BX008]